MRTRHWAYIGVALIAGNIGLLKAARAAELVHGYPFSAPAFLRIRLDAFLAKPKPVILAPVTIRLFADQKLPFVTMANSTGFFIANHRIDNIVSISVKGKTLVIRSGAWSTTAASKVEVRAFDDGAFKLISPRHTIKWTRGEVTLRLVKDHIELINRLALEDYVGGILEGELGSIHLSPEVLKAQIIVARTYTLSMQGHLHRREGYDFCDQPHCQVFSGIPIHQPVYEKVIQSVRGDYLSFHGRPIAAFYHHNCGGMTSAADDVWPVHAEPYLQAVREPENNSCQIAPQSRWRISLSKKSLALCFKKAGWLKSGDAFEGIQIIRKDLSGRAQKIQLLSRRPTKVTIAQFRNVVNQYYQWEVLKSAMFTVSSSGDSCVFNGRGWGHGVGLCQEGAMWMARHGKTYREILSHYFPKTTLVHPS